MSLKTLSEVGAKKLLAKSYTYVIPKLFPIYGPNSMHFKSNAHE
jgi:hypothetical protein